MLDQTKITLLSIVLVEWHYIPWDGSSADLASKTTQRFQYLYYSVRQIYVLGLIKLHLFFLYVKSSLKVLVSKNQKIEYVFLFLNIFFLLKTDI